jgi:hypothetical protein
LLLIAAALVVLLVLGGVFVALAFTFAVVDLPFGFAAPPFAPAYKR